VQDAAKGAVSGATIDTLRKDAENQKAIMAKKGKKGAKGPTEAVANSMTPHLAMHSTRGVESGRGRREVKKQKAKYQKSVYGKLKLPPDEATPFFTTYVLHYAFPTIAIICTCLGCVLLRTMKMYQKERWKGTSYFHGACTLVLSSVPPPPHGHAPPPHCIRPSAATYCGHGACNVGQSVEPEWRACAQS